MLLVDWQIKEYLETGVMDIDPYDPDMVQPNSIDVRLGNDFVVYRRSNDIIDPYDRESIDAGIDRVVANELILNPNDFVLARTVEVLTLPETIVADLKGKSSLARLGIEVHQTAGWIDAGFHGTITLELKNVNVRPVNLYAGMTIGQIAFTETEPVAVPYNRRPGAKYNGQIAATPSRYFENKSVAPMDRVR